MRPLHLNDGDTPPYNTDFDGDEMNMHVPQSEETQAELSQIAWVPRQASGHPSGRTRQTNRSVGQVQNILLWVPEWDGSIPIPAIVKPKPLWTGKQILSLPEHIPVFDDGMIIENGEIIYGIEKTGPEATRQLFTGLQMVVNFWLFHNGFSIGIGDTIADRGTRSFITKKIADCKVNVVGIIEDATHDRLKAAPGMDHSRLNLARDDSGQYAQKNLKEDNNVKQTVVAGSKGSFINISQMSGRRIPFGFRHRTLPHFTKDDFSPEARGFVGNSYLRGLTPQEFFFHAMAGREGLINTAIKTAETGYIQRRLVKALEDVMVYYDGTVRNSLGDLIQFVYGEDGMAGAFIEKQSVDTFALNDQEFKHQYRVDVTDEKGGFVAGVLQVGLDDSSLELQAKLDEEYTQLVEDRRLLRTFIFPRADPITNFYLPVNLMRIVQNFKQIFHIDHRKPSDLEPAYIVDAEAQQDAVLRFRIRMRLRATFATRRVLERHHLNQEAFDWVLGEVESKFNQAIANPGEMCGTLAAHKNVTLGVPRLKEIINVATNIKTPSLSVYLNPDISGDSSRAQLVAHELEYTSFRIPARP
ncbi:RNA polymerase II largest subunit [Mycena galericulata]|nr:RNA polymerase II largest subunit [Mycena galericulata]